MKLYRISVMGLAAVVSVFGLGAVSAAALDAHTTTRARTTEPHLTQPHHAATRAVRHSTSHAGTSRAKSTHPNRSARSTVNAGARGVAHTSRSVARTTSHVAQASFHRVSHTIRRHRYYERFTASSFASGNIFADDVTAGEDPVVRQAAINAMGDMNGTAVVIDPSNGRILAMVNQKLALSPGAEPCSTIKITVAMAALSERLVTSETPVQLAGFRMNMTQALAKSNNLYFEELGRELGFERVRHYANLFGLGELAGYNIEGEQLGIYPDEALPAAEGGVGRMCSFGQGVSLTPLQLGAFVAAIANGGTLYYLQHPKTLAEAATLEPKIKRTLDIAQFLPDLQDGMAGAVQYGTARSLRANFHELPVFGKTGTCSDKGTRFGWFASYSDSPQGRLVTVFFLEGGRPTFGPRAAEMTGEFYRNLWDANWFAPKGPQDSASVLPASVPQPPAQPLAQPAVQ
ncbi:MAG: penicillin-binding transpeptidase domain-containing protein [Terracidiphilus sp.]|jgi:membrane carboxypeptidase/penicillin-binding protein